MFFVLHRLHDLIGLGLLHARVVGALPDQQRLLDRVDVRERRTLGQQLLAFLGARIADARGELFEERLPVRRDRREQRLQVRRADDVDAARERVGREREADERRVAAVRTAVDGDLVLRA